MTPDEEAIQRVALLPCPFCGDTDSLYTRDGLDEYGPTITCGKCIASGPQGHTTAEAIAAWNTRASADWWRLAGADAGMGRVKRDE